MRRLLVLLAGQSNMSGRDYAEKDDLTEIPGLLMMAKDLKWRPAVEPITRDRPFVGIFDFAGNKMETADPWDVVLPDDDSRRARGVGPGRTFGRLLLEANPGCEVGLLPMSIGGTGLVSWMPGGADTVDAKVHPYDDAIRTARVARKDGEIVAILWHQGENDASQMNLNYKSQLRTVIENFRRDLDLAESVPFIMGELGGFYDRKQISEKGIAMVDEAMHQLSAEMKGVYVVPAKDLGHRGDCLHFSREAAHTLGRRYFEKFSEASAR